MVALEARSVGGGGCPGGEGSRVGDQAPDLVGFTGPGAYWGDRAITIAARVAGAMCRHVSVGATDGNSPEFMDPSTMERF